MQSEYVPPYSISDEIVNLVSDITKILTQIGLQDNMTNNPKLRRENRIKTIHASLAIENNTLSLQQVTDIIDGKRVLGPPGEICEVKNAFEAYEKLLELNPYSIDDILFAHKILMSDLTKEAGTFRAGSVGVFAGQDLVHMAPPANQVPTLMQSLIDWAKTTKANALIKSCVFHYEFEFIHPFADGNGRMGRMWQTLLLYQWNPLLAWLPVETLIQETQSDYYRVLGESDREGDSQKFIEYILQTMFDVLQKLKKQQVGKKALPPKYTPSTPQVKELLIAFAHELMTREELQLALHLSDRKNFREHYLKPAIEQGLVELSIPDKPNSSKQKYRLTPKGLLSKS